jgi:hypothetical protein
MKFCQDHWNKLRTAMTARGLDHLGAKSGEDAIASVKAELDGEETEFDPLMACHWMITSRAIEIGGLYLMTKKEDGGDYCPICEAAAHADVPLGVVEDYWINGPADAAQAEARKRGLVPGVQ